MKVSVAVVRNDLKPLVDLIIAAQKVDRPLREIGFAWLQLVRRGFALSRDPYGNAWLPVKRGGKPLLNTGGTLRDRFAFVASQADVVVGTNVKIAEYHQYGTRPFTILPRRRLALSWRGAQHPVRQVRHPGLPKRRMLPEQAEGLPVTYRDAVLTAFARILPK
jgi:phage gpG-like protein